MHLSIPPAAGTETRGRRASPAHISQCRCFLYRPYDDASAALLVIVYGASSGAPWARRKECPGFEASAERVHVREGPLRLPLPRNAVSGTFLAVRRISIVGCCCIAGKGCSPSSVTLAWLDRARSCSGRGRPVIPLPTCCHFCFFTRCEFAARKLATERLNQEEFLRREEVCGSVWGIACVSSCVGGCWCGMRELCRVLVIRLIQRCQMRRVW